MAQPVNPMEIHLNVKLINGGSKDKWLPMTPDDTRWHPLTLDDTQWHLVTPKCHGLPSGCGSCPNQCSKK
jgi:hypothetical protein